MPREVVHAHDGEKSRGLGVTGEAIHPSEVLARHGTGGNAEVLIQAVRDHNPPEITNAGLRKVNSRLTEALREGKLEGYSGVTSLEDVGKIAGEGATLWDVKVRGVKTLVYTATDSQGALYKGTFELDDPDGTHISQAEILVDEGTVTSQALRPKLEARRAVEQKQASQQQNLDAREKALAQREQEAAAKLEAAESKLRQAEASSSKSGEGENADGGGTPAPIVGDPAAAAASAQASSSSERPSFLPANFDELNADDAAKVVHGLEGEERAQAEAYERATKRRKTVLGE